MPLYASRCTQVESFSVYVSVLITAAKTGYFHEIQKTKAVLGPQGNKPSLLHA